jgi:hypothetical protein
MCVRNTGFALGPPKCEHGQVYNKDGVYCTPTCDDPHPKSIKAGGRIIPCTDTLDTRPRCECPRSLVWSGRLCIPLGQCGGRAEMPGQMLFDDWEYYEGRSVPVNSSTTLKMFTRKSITVAQAKQWCLLEPQCAGFQFGGVLVRMVKLDTDPGGSSGLPTQAGWKAGTQSADGVYQKPQCTTPMHPQFGSYSVDGAGFGARAVFQCRLGYVLLGSRVRVCLRPTAAATAAAAPGSAAAAGGGGSNGRIGAWSGDTAFCQKNPCSMHPPKASFARVAFDVDSYTANYTCLPGYAMHARAGADTASTVGVSIGGDSGAGAGAASSTSCNQLSGRWQAPPACGRVCMPPAPPPHTHVTLLHARSFHGSNGVANGDAARPHLAFKGRLFVGSGARYACDSGYWFGRPRARGGKGGARRLAPAVEEAGAVAAAGAVGAVTAAGAAGAASAAVAAASFGHKPAAEAQAITVVGSDGIARVCGADGRWGGREPTCHRVTCDAPATIRSGEYATDGKQVQAPVPSRRRPPRLQRARTRSPMSRDSAMLLQT